MDDGRIDLICTDLSIKNGRDYNSFIRVSIYSTAEDETWLKQYLEDSSR